MTNFITKVIMKFYNSFFKYSLFYVTFLVLYIKCILFAGFISHQGNFWSYILNQGLSHVQAIFYFAFISLLLCFSLLIKGRAHALYLFSINFIITSLMIVDLCYFRGFNSLPTFYTLSETSNLNNLWECVVSLTRWYDYLLLVDLLGFLYYLKANIKSYTSFSPKRIYFLPYVLIIASILFFPFTNNDKYCFYSIIDSSITSHTLTPVGFHILSSIKFYKDRKPLKLSEQDEHEIKSWFENKNKASNITTNKYKDMFKGKNLIIMQIESLENFVINKKINGQEIVPNLNKILKNSLYFSDYHEQVNLGTSSDADFLTNTSIYPLRQGSVFFRFPYNYYNSLPRLFGRLGYYTSAFHPDPGSYWNWMPALISMGFDKCYDSSNYINDEAIIMGLSDGSYLRQIEPIIAKQKTPFYTFLVTLTSHGPFNIPEKYRTLKINKDLDDTKLGGYLQSIHYVDKHIGIFLNNLDNDAVLDNSVIVIYGDHEGVHKYYNDEIDNPSAWKNKPKCIPLIIYSKGINQEEIKTLGGQVDLFPTICYLFGIPESNYVSTAMGKNLLTTNDNYTVFTGTKVIGNFNDSQKKHAIDGLTIADKIIRSNYYNKQK